MRKLLSLTAVILVFVMLSGCGFSSWQDEEELRNIQSITRVTDSEGNVYLEISYTDGSSSDRFLLPEGTFITGVETNYEANERKTTVTVNFSDGKMPVVFDIPDGTDGASVNDVQIIEKNGMRYLSFRYVDADGNQLNNWDINIEEFKGEDGTKWLFASGAPNEVEGAKAGDFYLDVNTFMVYNLLSDGSWRNMGTIKGTGIASIVAFSDANGSGYEIITTDDLYENGSPVLNDDGTNKKVSYKVYSSTLASMSVTYNKDTGMYVFSGTITDVLGNKIPFGTDGTIAVQRPSTWLSGVLPPKYNDLPEFTETPTFDGDFYYCTADNSIWTKVNGSWVLLISLSEEGSEETVKITFSPEGGTLSNDINSYPGDSTINVDGTVTVKIKKGQCYPSYTPLPVPEMKGYVFLGWYKTKDLTFVNGIPVNNGAFTDMVPVSEDITLYAVYVPASN